MPAKRLPTDCSECGMLVEPGNGYHSYPVCILMKATGDSNVAQAYAKQLMEDGAKGYRIGQPVTIVSLPATEEGK